MYAALTHMGTEGVVLIYFRIHLCTTPEHFVRVWERVADHETLYIPTHFEIEFDTVFVYGT